MPSPPGQLSPEETEMLWLPAQKAGEGRHILMVGSKPSRIETIDLQINGTKSADWRTKSLLATIGTGILYGRGLTC